MIKNKVKIYTEEGERSSLCLFNCYEASQIMGYLTNYAINCWSNIDNFKGTWAYKYAKQGGLNYYLPTNKLRDLGCACSQTEEEYELGVNSLTTFAVKSEVYEKLQALLSSEQLKHFKKSTPQVVLQANSYKLIREHSLNSDEAVIMFDNEKERDAFLEGLK